MSDGTSDDGGAPNDADAGRAPVLPRVTVRVEVGGEPVVALRIAWIESIGAPYRGRVEVILAGTLVTDALLGIRVRVSWCRAAAPRELTGIVCGWERLASRSDDEVLVALDIAPAIALARHRAENRVVQDLTAPAIAELVLGELLGGYGSAIDGSRLVHGHRPLDYRVQLAEHEDDLAFVTRTLAASGISYVFAHGGDGEQVVLVDDAATFALLEAGGDAGVLEARDHEIDLAPTESIVGPRHARGVAPGRADVEAWDWAQLPPGSVRRGATAAEAMAIEQRLAFTGVGAGRVDERGDGGHADDVSARAMQLLARRRARAETLRGRSNAVWAAPGCVTMLREHGGELEGAWRIERVEHHARRTDESGAEADALGVVMDYENRIEAVPAGAALAFIADHVARVRAHSVELATVTGPPGEELHCDAHGRVRVRMHWDTRGPGSDAASSCWLRVSQAWAGAGFGMQFLPRVGMEVVVGFAGGDPDQPLVLGCLYNGANPPPFASPSEATRSGVRTQVVHGEGYNELSFDDAKGAEQVRLHAHRDLEVRARRDHGLSVGASRRTTIGGDDSCEVGGARTTVVGGAESLHVGGSVAWTVDGAPGVEGVSPGMSVRVVAGGYEVSAPERIVLRCGATSLVLTPTGIRMVAPATIDACAGAATVAINPGAVSLLAPVLSLASAGAQLGLGASATMSATGPVTVGQGPECGVTFDGGTTVSGAKVAIEGASEVRVQGGSVRVDGGRVEVRGDEEVEIAGGRVVRLTDAGAKIELRDGVLALGDEG